MANITQKREDKLFKEIKKLRQELANTKEGARQLSLALDGLVARLAVKYGHKTQSGYELRIPPVDLEDQPFHIEAKMSQCTNEYIITAVQADESRVV